MPGIWDGPVWTLSWEVLCYIAVAGLGLAGLLRRRWFIPTALVLAVLAQLLPPWSVFADVIEAQRRIEDPATGALLVQAIAARFLVMFLAGAFLYKFRNAIPARWSVDALSVSSFWRPAFSRITVCRSHSVGDAIIVSVPSSTTSA